MASQFIPLTTVVASHGYFPNGVPNVLVFEPDESARHEMLRLGLVFRAQAGRLVILYDNFFAGSPRSREQVLAHVGSLTFTVRCSDPNFFAYTDTPNVQPISNYLFLFTNQLIGTTTYRDTLYEGTHVGADALVPLSDMDQTFFSKPFGQLRIHFHPGLAAEMSIQFKVKATYWRYVLTSDHLKELVNPAVVHAETKQAFIGPESVMLPGNRQAVTFRSEQPIPVSALPNKSIQLLEHYEPQTGKGRVVIGMMPNPLLGSYSVLGESMDEKKYLEIFL